MIKVLIADDEPFLRAQLRHSLLQLWPEIQIVAEAEDGFSTLRLVDEHQPDLVFLDIRMPGMTGLEVAEAIGSRCHLVFVTAHDDYALAAFEQGAIDYILKPAEPLRLAKMVARLKLRIQQPPYLSKIALSQLAASKDAPPTWIQASIGATTHFITLADVIYFQAEAKYTKVVTLRLEAHIRRTIKDLVDELDTNQFWQIHRGTIVAVEQISAIRRDGDGGMILLLRDHAAHLAVSQSFQSRFKQM